jgi:acyl-coenzyme A synthetase/AMP-(fatty) acid ligase
MHLLKGRSDDFIILPNGRKLSPLGLLNMENFAQISEYRVIQEKRDLIILLLKMQEMYKKESVAKCVSALQKTLGPGIKIKTEIVQEIPRDNSGKLRRIVSKVAS